MESDAEPVHHESRNLIKMNSQDTRSVSSIDADGQGGNRDGSLTVLLASPGTEVRDRLRERLQDVYETQEVSHWEALDKAVSSLDSAVVLIDLDLLRSGGIADLSVIRRISRKAPIILLSGSPNDAEGIAGLKAGARGYCERRIEGPLLRKAVDRVRDGEIWAERRLIPLLVEQYTLPPEERLELIVSSDRRLALLTRREREIARLIGAGASNRDIASSLLVSEGTVKAHLTAIFRKLGFSDRLQLGLFLANPDSKNRGRN
jgi:two-component system nitrate/nitrite response regulator NarL